MKKPWPDLKSDEDAERFVADADLTGYDFSAMKPVRFEFEMKTEQVNMRMPTRLLETVKARAKERGIPYQRFIRETLEKALQ